MNRWENVWIKEKEAGKRKQEEGSWGRERGEVFSMVNICAFKKASLL